MSTFLLGLIATERSPKKSVTHKDVAHSSPAISGTLPKNPALDASSIASIRKDAKENVNSPHGEKVRQQMEQRARGGDDRAKQWLKEFRGFQHGKNIAHHFRDEIVKRAAGGDENAQHNLGHFLFGSGSGVVNRNMSYLDPATKAKITALRKNSLLRAMYVQYRDDPSQTQTAAEAYQIALSKNIDEAMSGAGEGVKAVPKHIFGMAKNLVTNPVAAVKGIGHQFYTNCKEGGVGSAVLDFFTGSVSVYKANVRNLENKSSLEEIRQDYNRELRQYRNLEKHHLLTKKDHEELNAATKRFQEAEAEYNKSRSAYVDATGSAASGVVLMVAAGPILKGLGRVFKATGISSAITSRMGQLAARLPAPAMKALNSTASALSRNGKNLQKSLPPAETPPALTIEPAALPERIPASSNTSIVRYEPPTGAAPSGGSVTSLTPENIPGSGNTSIVRYEPPVEIIDPTDIVRETGLEPYGEILDAEFRDLSVRKPVPWAGIAVNGLRYTRRASPGSHRNGVLDSDVALLTKGKGSSHASEALINHQRRVSMISEAAAAGRISETEQAQLMSNLATAWKLRFQQGNESLVAKLERDVKERVA